MKEFIKDRIFNFIMVVFALVIAFRNMGQGETTHMWLWLAIAALNVITLVRDYLKAKKKD